MTDYHKIVFDNHVYFQILNYNNICTNHIDEQIDEWEILTSNISKAVYVHFFLNKVVTTNND